MLTSNFNSVDTTDISSVNQPEFRIQPEQFSIILCKKQFKQLLFQINYSKVFSIHHLGLESFSIKFFCIHDLAFKRKSVK